MVLDVYYSRPLDEMIRLDISCVILIVSVLYHERQSHWIDISALIFLFYCRLRFLLPVHTSVSLFDVTRNFPSDLQKYIWVTFLVESIYCRTKSSGGFLPFKTILW